MTIKIRRAAPWESERLSDLAVSSKQTWGYDDDFLASTRSDIVVAASDIHNHSCYVAEQDGDIVGFYLIAGDSLERLFVAPAWLRRGIGRALFEHAADMPRTRALRIVSDPHAAPFYQRMGAVRIGEQESPFIPGRKLPVYEYAKDGKKRLKRLKTGVPSTPG